MNHFQVRCGLLIVAISTLACNLSVAGGVPVPLVPTSTVDSTVSAVSPTPNLAVTLTPNLADSPSPEPSATLLPPSATSTLPPPTALPTNTPIPSATNTQPPNIPDWPLFRNGDDGPEVYAIQYLLRFHGQNLAVDGSFGPQTRGAVINFQNQKGLSADGVVGPKTWSALIAGVLIKQGSQGDTTRAVQTLLSSKFAPGGLAVDGNFGPQTDNQVRIFQECHHLGVDGIVGPQTWKALVALDPIAC